MIPTCFANGRPCTCERGSIKERACLAVAKAVEAKVDPQKVKPATLIAIQNRASGRRR